VEVFESKVDEHLLHTGTLTLTSLGLSGERTKLKCVWQHLAEELLEKATVADLNRTMSLSMIVY